MPNLVNLKTIDWWPSKGRLNYGLDIQGLAPSHGCGRGLESSREGTFRMVKSLKTELAKENVPYSDVLSSQPTQGQIEIVMKEAMDKSKLDDFMSKFHGTVLQEISTEGNQVVYPYFSAYLTDYKNKVISQAIETIRNRIDEFGVAEPRFPSKDLIESSRGMADAERAKQLINTTAKLDFIYCVG